MHLSNCPCCDHPIDPKMPYCPYCGAKIDSAFHGRKRFAAQIGDHIVRLKAMLERVKSCSFAEHENPDRAELETLLTEAIELLHSLRSAVIFGTPKASTAKRTESVLSAISRIIERQDTEEACTLFDNETWQEWTLINRAFICRMMVVVNELINSTHLSDASPEGPAINASHPSARPPAAAMPPKSAPAAESPKHSRPAKKGPIRKAAEFLSGLIRNGEKKEAASPPSTVMHNKIIFEIDKSHSMSGLAIPEPKSQLDSVEFRVAAPKALARGCSALVKFMMYSPDEYEKADRIAKYIADQVAQNVSSEAELERGTTLRICLQSKDVDVEDDSREIVWNGRLSSCDFKVTVPETFSGKQIELTARVYNGLAVLTDLKLILDATGETVSPPAEKCRLKSAFLSYSSNDRSRVIACMRGMLLARSDMDIFIDVIKLRRGEHWEERLYHEIDQRDLFYLFWSRSAAKSEWVKRELEYALKTKGADAVEPVPLELPEVCPPPAALNDRHFNDWMLLYELQCRASENQKPVQE